ncbi:nitrogenase component 1 [Hydrogenobaculum acidophilum]
MKAVNFILGFHTYLEDYPETKRIANSFGIDPIILSDPSENLDSGMKGEYKLYNGGTPLKDIYRAKSSEVTICFQKYSTEKTREYIEKGWNQATKVIRPYGIKGTDEFLMTLSQISGMPVPKELEIERQKLLDAIADSYYWINGKRFALWGDPDFVYGMTSFLLELGAEPIHILCTNANDEWAEEIKNLCSLYPNGQYAQVFPGKDLWHMRSLLFTEPVDYMIGTSYGKYLWRDTGTPLIRIGYPIFDRHHLHRYGILFYKGALNMLVWIVNTILDETDRNTLGIATTDYSFDLIR